MMKRTAVLLALGALALASLGLAPGSAQALARRHVSHLVVAELFTAQGCVSCDKASGPFADLADRPDVVALTLPVDYWDYLGWRDTFAMADFTARQKAYERHFGLRDVYTPQLVVDGATQASGDDAAAVTGLIADARHALDHGPEIKVRRDGRVAIGAGPRPRGGAEIWLMRYDPKSHDVQVKGGDNHGATVTYRHVVRQLVRLGAWTGHEAAFKTPAAESEGLKTLILVQGAHGGKIIAARVLPGAKA
jgi:hypothetical protein